MNNQAAMARKSSGRIIFVAAMALGMLLLILLSLVIGYVRVVRPISMDRVEKIEREPTILLLDVDGEKFASRLAPGPRVHDLLEQSQGAAPGARNIIDAVIAIEDRNFWKRSTFDPTGFLALGKAFVAEGRGGSTLTMQIIKNLYWIGDQTAGEAIDAGNPAIEVGKNRYIRKLQEIVFAPDLEGQFDKEQLLGVYMRVAPDFGGRTVGMERLAQFMYGVYPDDLSAAQAASLAAMLKAPVGYDPRRIGVPDRVPQRARGKNGRQIYIANSPLRSPQDCGTGDNRLQNNRCRALTVLAEMRNQEEGGLGAQPGRKMLSEAEYQAAVRELLTLGTCDLPQLMAQQRAIGLMPPDESRCRRAPRQFVTESIDQVEAMGLESRPGTTMEIRTTFNRQRHAALFDVVEALRRCQFPPYAFGLSTIAVDGQVSAMIEVPSQGLPPPKGEETTFGVPPGSTLKPFIYGTWLDQNPEAGPATLLPDSNQLPAVALDTRRWVQGRGGQPWWPNRSDPTNMVTVEAALAKSRNRPATLIGAALGPEEISRTFARAGVNFYGRSGSLAATLPHYFPRTTADKWPMALLGEGGAARVLPVQLAAAYAAFANGGRVVTPQLVTAVGYVDNSGQRVRIATPTANAGLRLFSPGTTAAIDAMMAETTRTGTARDLGLDRFGVHGKTGTVSDARYGWFIGYPGNRAFINGIWLYSPKVKLRPISVDGPDTSGYVNVAGRDAARVYGALIRRQSGDLTPILPEDICPEKGLELAARLERAKLGAPGV